VNTRIYIDGYNLYFGCLKGSPFKWLNPVSLSERLLKRCGVSASVLDDLAVKFFTAEISQRAASDKSSLNDQRSYHLALHNYCGSKLKTIKGSYAIDKTKFPIVEKDNLGKEKEPSESERVKIWKMEEKQSDVNVALEAVYDAITDLSIEQVVFVTNDTDIVPALEKIKYHNTLKVRSPIKIGLIIPRKSDNDEFRQANKSLSALADWTIKYIFEEELAASQLPCRVVGSKTALKPIGWFKYPKKVGRILDTLTDPQVEKSLPRAWKWLNKPLHKANNLPYLEGAPANNMDDEEALAIIEQHVSAYATHKYNLNNRNRQQA
jgi:6-hydroxy-3-succinoylpyridine 3-monooxygenase